MGVDALLEEQTRAHEDLDLAVPVEDIDRACAALPEFERSDDEWPSSLVFRDARGCRIDCHPLGFDEHGDGWQANLHGEAHRWPREHLAAPGRIQGRSVRCISAELQLRWRRHQSYDDVDWSRVAWVRPWSESTSTTSRSRTASPSAAGRTSEQRGAPASGAPLCCSGKALTINTRPINLAWITWVTVDESYQ